MSDLGAKEYRRQKKSSYVFIQSWGLMKSLRKSVLGIYKMS